MWWLPSNDQEVYRDCPPASDVSLPVFICPECCLEQPILFSEGPVCCSASCTSFLTVAFGTLSYDLRFIVCALLASYTVIPERKIMQPKTTSKKPSGFFCAGCGRLNSRCVVVSMEDCSHIEISFRRFWHMFKCENCHAERRIVVEFSTVQEAASVDAVVVKSSSSSEQLRRSQMSSTFFSQLHCSPTAVPNEPGSGHGAFLYHP